MRVLHLSGGNMFGGVETFLVTLSRNASAAPEMEQHFGFCFEGRASGELRANRAPVHLLGAVRLRDPLSIRRARRVLRELLRQRAFDLAVCHGVWPLLVFGPAVRAAGLPLVFWVHDTVDGRHWLQRLARWTVPDLAVCNSRYTASLLPGLFPRVRREVVYYPVEPSGTLPTEGDRAAIRAELGTPGDAVVIAQVSRMEAWKGHTLHLRALALLRDVPGWVCWQVGGAQRPSEVAYRTGLERLAGELGIADRVRFLGQRSDVPQILGAADIHCQPNTGPEPFGIAFVEALYAGLPSVTTAMGGAQEIIDESCGVLVPPDDAQALGDVLRSLAESRDCRRRLGSAGPARAGALCAPERQVGRISALFSTLVRREAAG
ncbi:MAG TPA: glycosyltransferase [Longimicrobiaceae bacterium]|nr:glycosyltransferase [Longimicrobiaceae bacterium]